MDTPKFQGKKIILHTMNSPWKWIHFFISPAGGCQAWTRFANHILNLKPVGLKPTFSYFAEVRPICGNAAYAKRSSYSGLHFLSKIGSLLNVNQEQQDYISCPGLHSLEGRTN